MGFTHNARPDLHPLYCKPMANDPQRVMGHADRLLSGAHACRYQTLTRAGHRLATGQQDRMVQSPYTQSLQA